MKSRIATALAACGLAAAGMGPWTTAGAQDPSAAAASAPATGYTNTRPEPKVQRSVTEDSGARVDELRVRGQTQQIVVHSKIASAPGYEIGTSTDGRDTSQDKRSEGRSLWHLLSF